MARSHYWQYILNSEGQPVESVDITLYLAGTTTTARVYSSETGGTPSSAAPQASTNSDGFFEFWISNDSDDPTYGYTTTQKFKINWIKSGIVASSTIDNLDIFPPVLTFGEVEVSGAAASDTTKNKLVSNLLASGWEDHKNIVHSSSTPAHGLNDVDETSTNLTYNKLVNNYLAKGWEDHKDSLYTIAGSGVHGFENVDEMSSDTTYNKIMNNYLAQLWNIHTTSTYTTGASGIHGLEDVNLTSSDTQFNKLVSDYVANKWEDHRLDDTTDVHHQYMPISGSRIFTFAVSGQTPTESSHLSTKGYVDNVNTSNIYYTNTNFAPLSGNFIFTNPISGQTPTEDTHLVTKSYADSINDNVSTNFAPLSGNFIFTNPISGQTPTEDTHLVTKIYVDENWKNKVKYGTVAIPTSSIAVTGTFSTPYPSGVGSNYILLLNLETTGGSVNTYETLITDKTNEKFYVTFSSMITASDYVINYQATKI